MVAQHGGLTLGQHSCFFQAPQQQLFAPVPRMLTSSGRRVTGTPKERAQSGRWTNEEHLLFLQGLELHGKDWKKISKMIKTRSLVQIRSHAQKYFSKVEQFKQLHGVSLAAEPDCHLLMDGKRMATGCGNKLRKKKGNKEAPKRRLPIVRLSEVRGLPTPPTPDVISPPTTQQQQLQQQQQQQPLPRYQRHATPLVAAGATFYCDAATLSDSSSCTTDGEGSSSSSCPSSSSSSSSSTASGASAPFSLPHASLSFHHAGTSSNTSSSSSSATTSSDDDYQDLSLAAYGDSEEGEEEAAVGQIAQLFNSPDELEAFLTGMLAVEATDASATEGGHTTTTTTPLLMQPLPQPPQQVLQLQQPQRPLTVAAVLFDAAFVAEHQPMEEKGKEDAEEEGRFVRHGFALPLPHTPSYNEMVHAGVQQPQQQLQGQGQGRFFPLVSEPDSIYTTQQLLYQQQQGQSYGAHALSSQPGSGNGNRMLGSL